MTTKLWRLRQEFKFLVSDERGSYLALIAFILTGVLGFAGMGVDLAMWYQEKRTTQNIADAAAVAATHVNQRGGDLSEMTAAAVAEAIRNGYESGPQNQVTVSAATAGTVGTTTPVVDVEVRRAVPLFLLSVFQDQQQVIAAAASSGIRSQGSYCVIGLDNPKPNNTTSRNVEFIGNATATIPCGVHSNSTTEDSMYIGGNTVLEETPASATGGISIGGNATVDSQITLQSFFGYIDDPLATQATALPTRDDIAAIACAPGGSISVGSNMTIDPADDGVDDGIFKICGNLDIKPGNTLTLNAGTYYVEDGSVLIQGILEATGGVAIVLTGTTPESVGKIDIRAQAEVNWYAPDNGLYQGIAFMQDVDANNASANLFNGGASMVIRGNVYARNQQVTYNGGTAGGGCTIIVAKTIKLTGNSVDTYIYTDPDICATVGIGSGLQQNQVVLLQ